MIGGTDGSGLTQKAIHPNVFPLNAGRLCEIAAGKPWQTNELALLHRPRDLPRMDTR